MKNHKAQSTVSTLLPKANATRIKNYGFGRCCRRGRGQRRRRGCNTNHPYSNDDYNVDQMRRIMAITRSGRIITIKGKRKK